MLLYDSMRTHSHGLAVILYAQEGGIMAVCSLIICRTGVFALSSISIRGEMLKLVRALDPTCTTPAKASVAFNLCVGAAISALVGNGVLLLMMWPMSSLHADDVKRWDVEAAEFEKKKAEAEAAKRAASAEALAVPSTSATAASSSSSGAGTQAGVGSRSGALGGSGTGVAGVTATPASTGSAFVGPLARPVLEWSRDDVYTWAITSSRADAGTMPGLGLAADVAAKMWNANITGAFLMSSTPEELGQRCLTAGLQLSVVSSMADGVAALKQRAVAGTSSR